MIARDLILKYLYDNESDKSVDFTDYAKQIGLTEEQTNWAVLELRKDNLAYCRLICNSYMGKITPKGKTYLLSIIPRNEYPTTKQDAPKISIETIIAILGLFVALVSLYFTVLPLVKQGVVKLPL
jgi:hypothetical protein